MSETPILPLFPAGTAPGPSFVDLLRRVAPESLPLPDLAGAPLPFDVAHGTTVVAIRCATGVVMAGDRRATSGNLIADVPARPRVLAFVALTKPRVIELLLVTTVPTMFLAADGFPDWRTLVATLVGGALAAGGANALNC